MPLRFLALALLIAGAATPAGAELRGHGGPVRALSFLAGGHKIVSGSFDQSAIVWDLDTEAATSVLRIHDGAVKAVAALPDGRLITGGEDGRIALWRLGDPVPAQVIDAHAGPIAGLAVSSDGERVGSASWDGTARITTLREGAAQVLEGHRGNVNAIAFAPDGSAVTAGYDATLRRWPREGGAALVVTLPTALSAVVVAPDGEMIAAGADGIVRPLSPQGVLRTATDLQSGPITALALSPDGARLAAATASGAVAVMERAATQVSLHFAGGRGPVWALAFSADGRELLGGGNDGVVRRWDAKTGDPVGTVKIARATSVEAEPQGERGAQVFAACAACHALTPDGQNRAGPTLYGVFGRRIGSVPGYGYSEALGKLDLVWNAETIAKLFEIGPAEYTPGTKMPEQRVSAPDREALVRYLARATRPTN